MATFQVNPINVLGIGGYGQVLHATETSRGIAVAVKKSRVSLSVKRTMLHYEARVLQMLQGHPAIPSLHGYGRFAHFEYLAIDLCGKSVSTLAPESHGTQLKTVIIIAQQMISALQHIHSHGIVHRDIKPDNILVSLQDPSRIVLVDYGISCLRNPGPTVQRYNPEVEHKHVIGTLLWASLNAHHGCHLSWRDDLESLAYVLLFLLRADLPWSDPSQHLTIWSLTLQIRILKTKWSGSTLASGYPGEFGRFLDETRSLAFDDIPPYEQYLDMFNGLYSDSGFLDSENLLDWSPAMRLDCLKIENSSKPKSTNFPLEVGQLVSVQLLAAPTILGVMPGDEFWDLELPYDAPPTQALPAVVLECTIKDGLQHVALAALKRGEAPRFSPSTRITTSGGAHGVKTIPPWPLGDTYCYVFPTMTYTIRTPFVVAENTVQTINYRICPQDLEKIEHELRDTDEAADAIEDEVVDAIRKMLYCYDDAPLWARVAPLDPASTTVNWTSERAWFNEIVAISSQRAVDKRYSLDTGDAGAGERPPRSSYHGSDFLQWVNMQREREKTLTLGGLPPSLLNTQLDITLPCIKSITHTLGG